MNGKCNNMFAYSTTLSKDTSPYQFCSIFLVQSIWAFTNNHFRVRVAIYRMLPDMEIYLQTTIGLQRPLFIWYDDFSTWPWLCVSPAYDFRNILNLCSHGKNGFLCIHTTGYLIELTRWTFSSRISSLHEMRKFIWLDEKVHQNTTQGNKMVNWRFIL